MVFRVDVEFELGFFGGGVAVDLGFEEVEDFGPAFGGPLGGGDDAAAVVCQERVGQFVGRNSAFVGVRLFSGERWIRQGGHGDRDGE